MKIHLKNINDQDEISNTYKEQFLLSFLILIR